MLFHERHFILFFLAVLTLYRCLPWHEANGTSILWGFRMFIHFHF